MTKLLASVQFLAVVLCALLFFAVYKVPPPSEATSGVKYKVTLYSGGRAIREFECEAYSGATHPCLYKNASDHAAFVMIHGTYTIERIAWATGEKE